MFTRGNPHGFKGWVPTGGQTAPIAIDGTRLKWKKAQKKAKKNLTSDAINKSLPRRKPF